MAEKKEYRNSIRSRRMIREAFLELIREKEFNRITVTDIVTRADLNRSTFYAHYPDVNGVVEEIQEEIIRRNMELINQMQYRNILKDPMPYLQSIAATLDENLELFKKMGHTVHVHQQLDKYRRMMAEDILNHTEIPEEVRSSPLFHVRLHFFVGGIMNTYQQWAEGNLPCTLDEIAKEAASIIQKATGDIVNADWMQGI